MKVTICKLTRRLNPENPMPPMVNPGQGVTGEFMVPTDKGIELMESDNADLTELTINDIYAPAETFRPKIGYPVYVKGAAYYDYLRTSRIRSYYIHETDGADPDKLVLPKDFPLEDAAHISLEGLEKGDMLLATMNSIYIARPYEVTNE